MLVHKRFTQLVLQAHALGVAENSPYTAHNMTFNQCKKGKSSKWTTQNFQHRGH